MEILNLELVVDDDGKLGMHFLQVAEVLRGVGRIPVESGIVFYSAAVPELVSSRGNLFTLYIYGDQRGADTKIVWSEPLKKPSKDMENVMDAFIEICTRYEIELIINGVALTNKVEDPFW